MQIDRRLYPWMELVVIGRNEHVQLFMQLYSAGTSSPMIQAALQLFSDDIYITVLRT